MSPRALAPPVLPKLMSMCSDMKPEHARFLSSLPLVIHVPSEHFFLVHGGLLPFDPRRPSTDKHQPLAHPPSSDDELPDMPSASYEYPTLDAPSQQSVLSRDLEPGDETEELRAIQEHSLLADVPQNRDPWVLLNMRGVRKSGKVTRQSDRGTPWAKIWNTQMKRCGGFPDASASASAGDGDRDEWEEDEGAAGVEMPCYPATVVYGHAASRDLDVRRWTVGLDTGCLYGRRLTALVLTRRAHAGDRTSPFDGDEDEAAGESSDDEDGDDELEYARDGPLGDVNTRFASVAGTSARAAAAGKRPPKSWTRTIKFGSKDSHLGARLVSVKCPKVADLS